MCHNFQKGLLILHVHKSFPTSPPPLTRKKDYLASRRGTPHISPPPRTHTPSNQPTWHSAKRSTLCLSLASCFVSGLRCRSISTTGLSRLTSNLTVLPSHPPTCSSHLQHGSASAGPFVLSSFHRSITLCRFRSADCQVQLSPLGRDPLL